MQLYCAASSAYLLRLLHYKQHDDAPPTIKVQSFSSWVNGKGKADSSPLCPRAGGRSTPSPPTAAIVLTNAVESRQTEHPLSLVFLQSGGRYTLAQIWDQRHFGRELLQPKVKQTMVAEGAKYVEVRGE